MKKITNFCEICGRKFHGSFYNNNIVMRLCSRHLHQMHRNGKILERTRFDKNEIVAMGRTSKIILYDKKNNVNSVTIIDSENIDKVKKYKWAAVSKGKSTYVKTDIRVNGKRKTLYLPNLLIGNKKGFQVDHISGNTLDNRKINLRFATQQQNLMNKTKSKGYSLEKRSNLWHAYIGVDNKRINLGRFETKDEAAEIRREAELKYYGNFAKVK